LCGLAEEGLAILPDFHIAIHPAVDHVMQVVRTKTRWSGVTSCALRTRIGPGAQLGRDVCGKNENELAAAVLERTGCRHGVSLALPLFVSPVSGCCLGAPHAFGMRSFR
jgi:hypothetical protein